MFSRSCSFPQDAPARKQLAWLVGAAFVPATFFVWLITDHFHAGSVLQWNPGWVQNNGDFARPLAAFAQQPATVAAGGGRFLGTLKHFFQFWMINFGITLPLILALVILLVVRTWKRRDEPAPVKIRLLAFLAVLAVAVAGVRKFVCVFLVRVFPVRGPGADSAGRPGRDDPVSSPPRSNAIGGRRSRLPPPAPLFFRQSRFSFSPASSRPRPGNGITSS